MSRASRAKAGKRPPAPTRRRVSQKEREKKEKLEALIRELRDAVESLGIRVRRERLLREVGYHVKSGFCRLDGQEIFLVESDLAPQVQIDLLLSALAERDLSGLSLSEDIQRLMGEAEAG